MDSRIYRRQRGVFHYSVVKPYHPNDDQRCPGRAHTNPASILIDDEKEWEVETILDHRMRHCRRECLVKWKGCPGARIVGNLWKGSRMQKT